MLDTVAITLNENQFSITDYDRFSPSAVGLFQNPYYGFGSRGYFSCVQNPKKNEGYKPRLTLNKHKRGNSFTITLRIEFSVPKLVYGNNFDELVTTDFDATIEILLQKLEEMGVYTDYERLADGEVSTIHYSKNIPLMDYSTCSMIISELQKMDLSKKMDFSRTDYRNGGQVLHCHANSYEIVFYDKIKDLQQGMFSEKRSIENDNYMQADLFDGRDFPNQFDVIRMEVRLGNRRKIKAVLSKLGIASKLTFGLLFDSAIAQKVLQHYWHNIWQDLKIPLMTSDSSSDIYRQIACHQTMKPAKILQLVGALAIVHDDGVPGLHDLVLERATYRTWQRLKQEIERLKIGDQKKFAAVANIGQHIDKFEPLRLEDYEILKPCVANC